MSSKRISTAMDRIDRALARIETQAALAVHSGGSEDRLADQHEALRQSVLESLSQLDILIESLER